MRKLSRGLTSWKDLRKSALRGVVNWQTKRWSNWTELCFDDHIFKKEQLETVGELPDVCSQIGLKCLRIARIGRFGILGSVNKLARAIT